MTDIECRLIANQAALNERAERLRTMALVTSWDARTLMAAKALKSQIRDLETERHALLQELPLT